MRKQQRGIYPSITKRRDPPQRDVEREDRGGHGSRHYTTTYQGTVVLEHFGLSGSGLGLREVALVDLVALEIIGKLEGLGVGGLSGKEPAGHSL